jgi:hypothetical protein
VHDDQIPVFVDDGDGAALQEDDDFFSGIHVRGGGSDRAQGVRTAVLNGYGPALDLAEQAVRSAAARFRAMGEAVRPDEVELQFGVTVKGEGNVGIAKGGAEAQLRFTFRWNVAGVPVVPFPRADAAVEQAEQPERADVPEPPVQAEQAEQPESLS